MGFTQVLNANEYLTIKEIMARTESSILNFNSKLYLLLLRSSALPQLLLMTKDKKEMVNWTATNTAKRAARTTNGALEKRKRDEIRQDIKESIPDYSKWL